MPTGWYGLICAICFEQLSRAECFVDSEGQRWDFHPGDCAVAAGAAAQSEPTPDQSHCEVGNCQACSGYTEDEADPETCFCPRHDPID